MAVLIRTCPKLKPWLGNSLKPPQLTGQVFYKFSPRSREKFGRLGMFCLCRSALQPSTSLFLSPMCLPLYLTLTRSVTQQRQQGPDLIFFYCVVIPPSPRERSPVLPCHHLFMIASKNSAWIHNLTHTPKLTHKHTHIKIYILVALRFRFTIQQVGPACFLV